MPRDRNRVRKRPPFEKPKPARKPAVLPDKAAILAFLSDHPGDAGKREIARAFGIKGGDKIALKQMLRELEEEGALARGRKRSLSPRGKLPELAPVEIIDQDPDGELLGRPVEWHDDAPPPYIVLAPSDRDAGDGPALGIGDRVLARLTKIESGYKARVVRRLGHSAHRVLGVVRRAGGDVRVQPVDRKSRLEFVIAQGDDANAKDGELVVVEPAASRLAGMPRGRISERLGALDSPKAVSLIAVHAHNIPVEFSSAALDEAARASPADLKGRTDLRAIPLVTIDPPDARDHDDAVFAEPDSDPKNPGGHIVVVAIADVAHYVTPGSALDREALRRGNSVYFPDRVVPMLPERLSADLCSLKPDGDRACLAVRMTFGADGRKRGHRFVRGLMRSAARLTYAQAQAAADGEPDETTRPLMDRVLTPLWNAYTALAKARDARSPLDLDLPERRIVLDAEGRIASIAFRERLESMRLIEEFMIQANVAAAEQLEDKRTPLLYRIHDTPSREKLVAFAEFLQTLGQSFALGQVVRPATFNRILERMSGTPHKDVINEVILRTQAQAVYAADNVGHFGLNLMRYAHFTSPIRRYADLVVHRALIRGMKFGDDGLTDGEIERLPDIGERISGSERRAMAAEREATDRYLAAYLHERVGETFRARISGVTRFGLFVRLADNGADGLVPVRELGSDFFVHDEARHALVGERTGLTFRLGDTVEVRLVEATPVTGGLRFELIEGGVAGTPARSSHRGRGRPVRTPARAKRPGAPKRR